MRHRRREIHLAFEPVECEVAGRPAFGENAPGGDSRAEFVETFMHRPDRLLHERVVAGLRCTVQRFIATRQSRPAFVQLLIRQRLDLGTFFRRDLRERHQRRIDRCRGRAGPATSSHAAARRHHRAGHPAGGTGFRRRAVAQGLAGAIMSPIPPPAIPAAPGAPDGAGGVPIGAAGAIVAGPDGAPAGVPVGAPGAIAGAAAPPPPG